MWCGKLRKMEDKGLETRCWWKITHDECSFRGMMWADNSWLFSVEELLNLDMEAEPESLWWTSTDEDEGCDDVEGLDAKGKLGTCPS